MNKFILPTAIALTVWLTAPAVRGEVFLLTNGGRIEGEWVNRGTEPPAMYEIEMVDGGHVTLAAEQVDHVVVKSDAVLAYEAALPKVPNTLEGHWAMAERCRKAGLKPQREFHLRKVLEFDPGHAEARHALGFSLVSGEWIKADEWLQEQGFVRHKGSWRLPQEVELDAQSDRQSLEEKEWRKRLRVWRNAVVRGRNDGAEALAQIKSVDSAFAITGLAELLGDKDEVNQLKLVYIEVLGRFNNSNAAAALLERVMKDPDLEVRERSIEALRNHGANQAVAVLSKALLDKDNQVVNQAGWALGKLGAPSAIPALLNAVVTKHRFKIVGGNPGAMSAGFSPTGGMQFSPGGQRPRIVEQDMQNSQVLTALIGLTPPGTNFGYDEPSWKNWWAQQQFDPNVNLRRNP